MESILPTNEYTEVEGRVYANPQVGIDESNTFIDNLRATQGQQNQEIFTDTQMLGTDVPSDIGGLTGANSYFTSRYQTPMTNAAIDSLRATAQAAALNQVLANEQAIWKKRYQDAYRNYQKRNYNRSRYGGSGGSGGGGGGNDGNTSGWQGDIEDEVITDSSKTIEGAVPGVAGGYTVANFDPETGQITGYTGVPYGEDYKTNYNYKYSDGAPKTMNTRLPLGSSTIFSGDKNKYLGTGGKL